MFLLGLRNRLTGRDGKKSRNTAYHWYEGMLDISLIQVLDWRLKIMTQLTVQLGYKPVGCNTVPSLKPRTCAISDAYFPTPKVGKCQKAENAYNSSLGNAPSDSLTRSVSIFG